jgi:hypothetical protein
MLYLELVSICEIKQCSINELRELADGNSYGDEEIIRARELFMILSVED